MADTPKIRRRAAASSTPAPQAPAGAPAAADLDDGRTFRRTPPQAQLHADPAAASAETERRTGLSELEALAGMDLDMASLLAGTALPPEVPEPGTRVKGVVSRVTADIVYVDVGARAEGWIPRREFADARTGDSIEAFVVVADDLGVHLSRRLSGDAAVELLEDAMERKLPVEGTVESRNSGGYTIRVGTVRAFCPISHISRLPLIDPDSVLGKDLTFLVLETGDKIVLSRRALEEEGLDESAAAARAGLVEGATVEAVITSVQSWGAFLDHEGVDLRLSKRDWSWDDVADLTTQLDRGQRLQVTIQRIDEAGRIHVTARDPALDPWQTVTQRFGPGTVVQGTVTGSTEFGTFVQIAPGLQGLIHRSRLARSPASGQALEVRVLSVDPERRRLELAPSSFDPEAQAANGVGVTVTGEVVEVTDRGVALTLEDGRRAWLPSREVELDAGTVLAQRFRVGHAVTARVTSVDEGRDRVTVSMRAEDSDAAWRDAMKQQPKGGTSMGTLGDLLKGWKR